MATILTVTNTASAPIASAPATAQGAAVSGNFATLLTGADAPADAATASGTPAATDAPSLQGVADDGKDLPPGDDKDSDDRDGNPQDSANAAALVWLALALPAAPLATPPPATATGSAADTSASVGAAPTTVALSGVATAAAANFTASPPVNDNTAGASGASLAAGSAKGDQRDTANDGTPARDPIALLASALRTRLGAATTANQATAPAPGAAPLPAVASVNPAPIPSAVDASQAGTPAAAPAPDAKPTPEVPPPAPVAQLAVAKAAIIGAVQPAAQAFAAALHVAEPASKRSDHDDGSIPTTQPFAGLGETPRTAAPDAAPATVDTRHTKWVEGIIDHIELLRDTSNAGDTRIRLLPDALGKIDVAIRKDGDTVNVRFSSDQAPTRQLLADAQPRLAEIAAGRGIRLGQTLIDGGDTGTGQQQRNTQQQATNARQPIANAPQAKGDDSDDTVETAAIAGWLA